jgi:hypothetical protein
MEGKASVLPKPIGLHRRAMDRTCLASFLSIALLSFRAGAQPTGLAVSFDSGSLDGWYADVTTYELEARDSALVIHYHRTTSSWEWHNFHFIPPESVRVSGAPKISLRVRSDIDTELTLKPIYSNGLSDWLPVNVPGDDGWRLYEFRLANYADGLLERIYFYLDGGTTAPRSGTVWFDDLLIGDAAVLPQVTRLRVLSQSPSAIELGWECDLPARVMEYRVYRGGETGFLPSREFLLASTASLSYRDLAVEPNRRYFYRVAAVDVSGREGPPSPEAGAHTYGGLLQPSVSVASVNRETVGLYEKFEIIADLRNVVFTNPFDPEQIDLQAEFLAPSGKVWKIPGFYDNYESRNQWKVRFAPNEVGQWRFRLLLSNQGQSASSETGTFTAISSPHHGWIRPSPANPHYFVHDDGTPFYGVAFYYPWGVTNGSTGLARLQEFGGNMFGYWNIMYGNEGRIIESLVSGLGRYDQAKCGRIDQILEWAESRNLMVMLAIWPHDLLCQTLQGWAKQWDNNPYKTICDVRDFYGSEEAWRYQAKQYRYLIARWGYSRSLAIWEIINEINGTDAWESGRQQEAIAWVGRVHRFFKENDPYGHPTTASMSGGWYRPQLYQEVDLPNVHLYETGWRAQFPNDPLRSSYYTYFQVARQMYRDFAKPAILGEAGYTDSYGGYPVPSPEYTTLFHNALWASWAGGLSASPFWWAFNYAPISTDDLLRQLRSFSTIVQQFPYAYLSLHPAELSVESCDAFGMASENCAFGWIRHQQGKRLGSHRFVLRGLADTTYVLEWYDTWRGQRLKSTYHWARNGVLELNLPELGLDAPDVAFFAAVAEEGDVPRRLILSAYPQELLAGTGQESRLTAVVVDSAGRICARASIPLVFELVGPGAITGEIPQLPQGGTASVTYVAGGQTGHALVIVRGEGLEPDSVIIWVRDSVTIDDFEDYTSSTALDAVWRVKTGTSTTLRLAEGVSPYGRSCLRLDYAIGNGSPPYAGASRDLGPVASSPRGLRLWLKPDDSGRTLSILLLEANGRYWQYDLTLSGSEGRTLEIPFSSFRPSKPSEGISWSEVKEISLLVFRGNGAYGQGSLHVDGLELLYREVGAGRVEWKDSLAPQQLRLLGNYPNPFNDRTVIAFELPRPMSLRLEVLDVGGRLVETLWEGPMEQGEHVLHWDPKGEATGLYLICLSAGDTRLVRKCLYLK